MLHNAGANIQAKQMSLPRRTVTAEVSGMHVWKCVFRVSFSCLRLISSCKSALLGARALFISLHDICGGQAYAAEFAFDRQEAAFCSQNVRADPGASAEVAEVVERRR